MPLKILLLLLVFAEFVPLAAVQGIIDPIIYQNMHGYYYVPKNHYRPAVATIKEGKVWEETTLNYIQKNYEHGTAIIHAGTYFGDMLPFFSKLAGTNHVWAFEPAEINFICAKATRLLNQLKNVNLFQLALSNKNSQVCMRTKRNGIALGGSSKVFEDKPDDPTEIELVDSVRLDDIIPSGERIGIIHLDVEGHELKVLEGAQRIIAEHHPILILEVWSHMLNDIDKYVTALGYTFVAHFEGNNVYRFHGP